MVKVGIVGNYGHSNNGDEAILAGIIKQLNENMPNVQIIIFSNNPQDTEKRYGYSSYPLIHKEKGFFKSILKTLYSTYIKMRGLDLVLIGGGGLMMDLYKRDAPLYATMALLARLAKAKVMHYAVGAGPIRTPIGKFFIKLGLLMSEKITVRDEESKILLQSLGFKNIKVTADPAFALKGPKEQGKTSTSSKVVGVTAVPYFSELYWPNHDAEKYLAYKRKVALLCDYLVYNYNYKILFFATKFPEDMQVTKEIKDEMKYQSEVDIIEDNLKPIDIINTIKKCDFIIGTRLHSLILAVVADKPIIGLSYHRKVKDFMKVIGQKKLVLEIDEISQRSAKDKIEFLLENKQLIQEQISNSSNVLKIKSYENLELAKSILQGD